MLTPKMTINCRGKILLLQRPIVMGILNVTPDSFYDGGQLNSETKLLKTAEKMLTEGASILDVGGMSSRPGAAIISVEEERRRVLPAIEALAKQFPEAILSVDTVRSVVAAQAIEAGAAIINDISAGSIDSEMYETVAKLNVPYILMHLKGTPKTMQLHPTYEDVVQDILDFLIQEVGKLRALGVKDLIVDPGFGFGKTLEDNYKILKSLHVFQILELPILAGLSRKSMIYKLLKTTPQKALNGTTALNSVALQQGAKLLRVHDVREAVETITLWERIGRG